MNQLQKDREAHAKRRGYNSWEEFVAANQPPQTKSRRITVLEIKTTKGRFRFWTTPTGVGLVLLLLATILHYAC